MNRKVGVVGVTLATFVGLVGSMGEAGHHRLATVSPGQFQLQNPSDIVGLDRAVFATTGEHVAVGIGGLGQVSPAVATRYLKSFDGPGVIPLGGIPAFSVAVTAQPFMGPIARNTGRSVTVRGSWNFPDSWAGQASPTDFASLQLSMPSCIHMTGLTSATFTYNNKATNLGYLKTSNVGQKAPIWAISDHESGFVSQADHGYVQVTLTNTCGKTTSIGADFSYEANQGGSNVSASAGWGFLSVSYGSGGLDRQQGTKPIYFNSQWV